MTLKFNNREFFEVTANIFAYGSSNKIEDFEFPKIVKAVTENRKIKK